MTDAEFLDDLLVREGPESNNPNDPGKRTNHGITQKVWNEWCAAHSRPLTSVHECSVDEAKTIYREWYFARPGFDLIVDDLLRHLVVDCGVNNGRDRATRWLQSAVGAVVDGDLGPKTLAAIGLTPAIQTYFTLCAIRFAAYSDLSDDKDLRWALRGWDRRATLFVRRGQVAFGMAA